MRDQPNNPIRKAAVLLDGLEPEVAESLFARLPAHQAAALREAVATLGPVDASEQEDVANELRSTTPSTSLGENQDAGGSGVELQLGAEAVEASHHERPLAPRTTEPTEPHDWFESVCVADADSIVTFLRAEQPRAAALVLSYLSPELASTVLSRFDAAERSRLLGLLSRQGEADPQSVKVIATELSDWIQRQNEEQRRRTDRISTIRSILSAAPLGVRSEMLQELRQNEPGLAHELGQNPTARYHSPKPKAARPLPTPPKKPEPQVQAKVESKPAPRPPKISYKQLEGLDAGKLSAALAMLDSRTALLALAGSSDALFGRIESQLSRSAAKELRRRIARLGQTTLTEVDQAQLALAYAAERVLAT